MPFHFNSDLLTIPIRDGGFGFSSIRNINTAVLITGIRRDLNHPARTFANIARITLADWSCQISACRYPLWASSTSPAPRVLSRFLPTCWAFLPNILHSYNLSMTCTDLSYVLSGDVSLFHLFNNYISLSNAPASLSLHVPQRFILQTLCNQGYSLLRHVGHWSSYNGFSLPVAFHPSPDPNIAAIVPWLKTLPTLLSFLSPVDTSLLLPRSTRQTHAENAILALSHNLLTSRSLPLPPNHFASDGSSITTNQGLLDVTASACGDNRVFAASLANLRGNANIATAEAYGILLGTLLAIFSPLSSRPLLLSDHLNSVRLLNTCIKSPTSISSILFNHPCRSLFRWILSCWLPQALVSTSSAVPSVHTCCSAFCFPPANLGALVVAHSASLAVHSARRTPQWPPILEHVRAHTSRQDIAAQLNNCVDSTLSRAHHFPQTLPRLPVPTFAMDDYMLYSLEDGYVEAYIPAFLDKHLNGARQRKLQFTHDLPLQKREEFLAIPEFPYTRAASAYSAVVQLYARSHQLDTATRLHARLCNGQQPWCRHGCTCLESAHHVFVACPAYQSYREEALSKLTGQIISLLEARNYHADEVPDLNEYLQALFCDSGLWPNNTSSYYVGALPPLTRALRTGIARDHTEKQVTRLKTSIYSECHIAGIHLAARIWGHMRRKFAPHSLKVPLLKKFELPRCCSHVRSSSKQVALNYV